MSINAIEVLESRIAGRVSVNFGGRPFVYPENEYHSPAWWAMLWRKHEEWREENYPAPAATGYEVTPATGKVP